MYAIMRTRISEVDIHQVKTPEILWRILHQNRHYGHPPFCISYINEVNTMKELYLNAEMDVVEFAAEDIIVTSPDTTASTQNPNCPNEGPAGDSFL